MNKFKDSHLQEYREYARDFLFKSFTPVAIVDPAYDGGIDKDDEFDKLPKGAVLYALINHRNKNVDK